MSLLSEIHFWTAKEDVFVKHTDLGVIKYFSKKDQTDNVIRNSKKVYCEKRGIVFKPMQKRIFLVKDKLKELEEYFLQNKVVCSSWGSNKLQLLISKGILVTITTSNSIITDISFNKSLVPKIHPEFITDGVIVDHQVVCICSDGRILGQGGLWKDCWILDSGNKKKVSVRGGYLCVWGRTSSEHPQPWTPVLKDHQKANLLLYNVGVSGPELQAYCKTEGEPVDVIISKVHTKTIITIDQKVSLKGAVCVEVNVLELTASNLQKVSVIAVPLQTQVSCSALSENENFVILGCIDGSVALLDRSRGSTRIVKTSIIPTFVVWHKNNALAAISNEKGQIQYYDTALNRINTQIFSEDCASTGLLDLSGYFPVQLNVTSIKWGQKDVVVVLDQGPLVLITHVQASLSFTALVEYYLKIGSLKKAITLLISGVWNDECFCLLQKIVCHLLKQPFNEENVQNLQNALGFFHNSPVPFSNTVKTKYGFKVRALTRRFFHQLIRYKLYETAFLLAIDIGHHDLFMDLFHCAIKIDNKEMATAARAQASSLLSRPSSQSSSCSRSDCSECSHTSGDSSNESFQEHYEKLLPPDFTSAPALSFNENFLTTAFNDFTPKSYHTEVPEKVTKPTFTPKFTCTRPAALETIKPITPPLPVTSYVPRYSSTIHSSQANIFNSACSAYSDYHTNFHLPTSHSVAPSSASSFLLPDTSFNSYLPSQPPNGSKKQQAKVKFSDTVTAFIVPEVKRPVRPPPPPHITDPQKELADSLPLCHPNEDYLKDFTPAKHNEPEVPPQTKIKVVHFGIV